MMWHRRAVESALTGRNLPGPIAERVQRLIRQLDDGLAELNRALEVGVE